jgi:hypothetical protein
MNHLNNEELALVIRALETHADVYPDDPGVTDLADRLRKSLQVSVAGLVEQTDADIMQTNQERADAAARAGYLRASAEHAAQEKARQERLFSPEKRSEESMNPIQQATERSKQIDVEMRLKRAGMLRDKSDTE